MAKKLCNFVTFPPKLQNPYCHKIKGDAFVSKLVGMRIPNLAMNKCVEIVEILANLNSLQTEFQDIYKLWLHKKPAMIMKNFNYFLLFKFFILDLINRKIFAFFSNKLFLKLFFHLGQFREDFFFATRV